MNFKQLLNLIFVSWKKRTSLTVEFSFNFVKLWAVGVAHLNELSLHSSNQAIDVESHFLNRGNVVLVFICECINEFLCEVNLVLDDFLALFNLNLDVLKS